MSSLKATLDRLSGRKRQTHFIGDWTFRLIGLPECGVEFRGKSVLDVGCNVGIVAYEIAKQEPASIHGIDYQRPLVEAARLIFRGYPAIRHRFDVVDLLHDRKLRRTLDGRYDVTLFLSVWQHIHKVYGAAVADTVLMTLAERTGSTFIARTYPLRLANEFAQAIERHGFEERRRDGDDRVLAVYERRV